MKRSVLVFVATQLMATLLASGCSGASHRKTPRAEPIELPLKPGSTVGVLALSPSTLATARQIIEERKWNARQVPSRTLGITVIAVVVRSSLPDPLGPRYEKVVDLRRAAASCPNHNGPLFHTYLYAFSIDEQAFLNVDHWAFRAD